MQGAGNKIMPVLIHQSSPNFNERDKASPLRYVVLHYTGMVTGKAALDRLIDPKSEVSAHYLVEEDGRVFQLVDEDKRAWHAGKSFWSGVRDMNSASIGIELVNPGHQFGYRVFPVPQIAALKDLLCDIIKRHNLRAVDALLAHSDIAPGRKEDPGELFPWQELAKDGFGLWPQPEAIDYAPTRDDEVQNLLRIIGYDCPASGDYDRSTREALLAFQRHYEPNNLTGTPEKETVARLRALIRMRQ
jgi:N-acetylmuramoyl-L-alanine amidase